MTQPIPYAEMICKRNVAKNTWNRNACLLCRKINKSTCPILVDIAEEQRQREKDYQPEIDGFIDERR